MILADKPLFQEFHLDGVKYISPEEALKLIQNDEIFFIDVREEEEFVKEYFDFENVFFHPMSVILDRLEYIPKNIPIVVVCSDGIRSTKVANLLNNYEIRTLIDDRNEKAGKKIRDAEMQKIPYMLIVGEKEEAEDSISVRKQGQGDLGSFTINDFAKHINDEINNLLEN